MRQPHFPPPRSRNSGISSYYRYHSHIYDLSRWAFLFGRHRLLQNLPELPSDPGILEVGCGTGSNIEFLQYRYPAAVIEGVDLSPDMLKKARNKFNRNSRIILTEGPYGAVSQQVENADLILFSYSLTMMGKQVETVLQKAFNNHKPGGYIAVADFHSSSFRCFRKWMSMNHVTLDGRIPPLLQKYYTPLTISVDRAYLGLWKYFTFIGQKVTAGLREEWR